jgi:hypothetical protein
MSVPGQVVRRGSVKSASTSEQTGNKDVKKKHTPRWMKKSFKFMDSGEVQLFLGVLLMLSLFLADSWAVGNAPDSQNEVMYAILMFVVVVFSFEVVILSIVADGYFNGFFFWMDLLGTISILLDIGWISDSFSSGQSVRRGSVLRATRAAKLGARYGRILRLMKLMKLAKMCPCLKSNIDTAVKAEPTLSAVVKISTELTGTISRRVAMLVVLTVIVVPFLSYSVIDYSPDAFMVLLRQQLKHGYCNQTQVDHIVHKFDTFYKHKDLKLVDVTYQSPFASCGGTLAANGTVLPGLEQTTVNLRFSTERIRDDNKLPYFYDFDVDGQEYSLEATIDGTVPSQWNALYGIILMILVIGILFGFSGSFHASIETLVVEPLQKLMSTLRKSATIMIDSLKSLEKEKKEEEKKAAADDGKAVASDDDSEEDDDEMETAMLENLVDKRECCAVLCCAVLCCAVLCCAVLCCAVLCCAVLC